MNQQEQYRMVKATREGEKLAKLAKEQGYFNKQEVHDLCAACLIDFLNEMFTLADPVRMGMYEDPHPVNKLVAKFQKDRSLSPNYVDTSTWHEQIKKD